MFLQLAKATYKFQMISCKWSILWQETTFEFFSICTTTALIYNILQDLQLPAWTVQQTELCVITTVVSISQLLWQTNLTFSCTKRANTIFFTMFVEITKESFSSGFDLQGKTAWMYHIINLHDVTYSIDNGVTAACRSATPGCFYTQNVAQQGNSAQLANSSSINKSM